MYQINLGLVLISDNPASPST